MQNDGITDLITFFLCCGLGVVLCLIYDIFRVVRLANKPSQLSNFFQDITYFVIAALLTFIMQLVRCKGETRWFVIIGEIMGFIVCRFTISRVIMAVSGTIIRLVKAVISFIKRVAIQPIYRLLKWVYAKLSSVLIFIFKKSHNLFKKILKHIHRLLYNNTKNKLKTSSSGEITD